MSLPTPPGTSHRDKENCSRHRVAWSPCDEYHDISNPLPFQTTSSACRGPPTKSILKPTRQLNLIEVIKKEVTPEPEDPLVNLTYIASPVATIVQSSNSSSLSSVIEAYSILAARLKAAVTGTTDADASWPLFQPFRQHRDAIVDAIVRDLGRVLINPSSVTTEDEEMRDVEKEVQGPLMLPSPKNSPKKKTGMSAEQVKYARDLSTTSHSVMKLLNIIFTLPAVYSVFGDEQLRSMLTAILSIPLALELPTPNARKTCALSIWLLQSQRLPETVLAPAKDRIAYAIRRGIDGELGKEGKKGSNSDGLKAIHDLSIFQPRTFIPAFTPLLSSILSNLLAPTLALRLQACHALGGFVLGFTSCSPPPASPSHISGIVASFITAMPSRSKVSSPATPSRTAEPTIIRTLRTTLGATDPVHAAHGPAWGLSVLASLVILLGPVLCSDDKLFRIISALLSLAMRQKKSSIKALCCLVWRCLAWVSVQPPFEKNDSDGESDEQETGYNNSTSEETCKSYWKLITSATDMGTGVATIAVLLADHDSGCLREDERDLALQRVLQVLRVMTNRSGVTCGDAVEVMRTFVSPSPIASSFSPSQLIPRGLFSTLPGLLTTEFKSLAVVVKPMFDTCPQLDDVGSLRAEDLSKDWVFNGLVALWKNALKSVELGAGEGREWETPKEIIEIWEGLLKANISTLQEADDEEAIAAFASRCASIITDIITDGKLDLNVKSDLTDLHISPVKSPSNTLYNRRGGKPVEGSCSSGSLRLSVARDLWLAVRNTIPENVLYSVGESLLTCLLDYEASIVVSSADDDFMERKTWASFCAELCMICGVSDVQHFWRREISPDARWKQNAELSVVWRQFAEQWMQDMESSWECAVVLLSAPFFDTSTLDMDADDLETWELLLQRTINNALDYGIDAQALLDRVAASISSVTSVDHPSATRIADILLTHIDIADARQAPLSMMQFVNEVLLQTYPPPPRNVIMSCWLLRTLTRVVDQCPAELIFELLDTVQDGLCFWVSDKFKILSNEEYIFDILPLYQTLLLGIQTIPRSADALEAFAAILESGFTGRDSKSSGLKTSFIEFWETTYASLPVPPGGWSASIEECLEGAGLIAKAEYVNIDDAAYEADISLDAGEVNAEDEISSPNTQVAVLKEQIKPKFLSASPTIESHDFLRRPSTPTKPVNSLHIASTPQRPQKSSSSFSLLQFTSSPSRMPLRQGPTTPIGSPGKRRKLDNKENVSPVVSVIDRIAAVLSPTRVSQSTLLGKRRAAQEWQEGGALKKGKPLAAETDSDDDERSVRELLVGRARPPSALVRNESGISFSRLSSKKRKRCFMEAVEVPTLPSIISAERPISKSLATHSSIKPTPLLPLARMASTSPLAIIPRRQSIMAQNTRLTKSIIMDSFLSSDPRDLEDLDVSTTSDDSIMLVNSHITSLPETSSDDDPHIGQVTPHHLISPALRRVSSQDRVVDPPSDDSNPPSSPSRQVAARRMQRPGLFYLKPTSRARTMLGSTRS